MNRKIVFLVCLLIFLFIPLNAFCEEADDIGDTLNSYYNDYDFTMVDNLSGEFSAIRFSDIVSSILNGTFDSEEMIWQNVINIIMPSVKQITKNAPILLLIILAMGILDGISTNSTELLSHMNVVGNALIAITLISEFAAVFLQASRVFITLSSILDVLLPILTVALVASGAVSTAAVLNPDGAVLSQTVNTIVSNIIMPIIIIVAVLAILEAVFAHDKFNGIVAFGKSSVNWAAGFIFTVYAGIISIKGLVASSYDGISLRTVRYAMNNSIPLVGSLIGDGMNMALACSSLVKSAIGIAGFVLIVLVVASPIVSLIIYMFMLKALIAFSLPFISNGTAYIMNVLADLTKSLISLVVGMTIIFIIIIGFAIGAASVI